MFYNRSGEHRAFVTAKLLEQRQAELLSSDDGYNVVVERMQKRLVREPQANEDEEKELDNAAYILDLVEDKEGLPLLDIICQRFPCKALVLIRRGFDPCWKGSAGVNKGQ